MAAEIKKKYTVVKRPAHETFNLRVFIKQLLLVLNGGTPRMISIYFKIVTCLTFGEKLKTTVHSDASPGSQF